MLAQGRGAGAHSGLRTIKHLEEFFGAATLAVAITKDRIDDYIGSRRKEGAKDATIHAEIAALSKMFTCATEAGKLTPAQRPMFPSLGVIRNARKGVFEESQYAAVLKELPEDLKPLVETYYWRKGELLTLRWSQIDFLRGEMRLDGAHTKNGQPRVFPFSGTEAAGRCSVPPAYACRSGREGDQTEGRVGVPPARPSDQVLLRRVAVGVQTGRSC